MRSWERGQQRYARRPTHKDRPSPAAPPARAPTRSVATGYLATPPLATTLRSSPACRPISLLHMGTGTCREQGRRVSANAHAHATPAHALNRTHAHIR